RISLARSVSFASLSIGVSMFLWGIFTQKMLPIDLVLGVSIFLLLSWFIFLTVYHVVAKALGGTASIRASLQAGMQVKAVLYLLGIFASVGTVTVFSANEQALVLVFFCVYEILNIAYVTII